MPVKDQIEMVGSFQELINAKFYGNKNAVCWRRNLRGDFNQIATKFEFEGNIAELKAEDLERLELNSDGQLAREVLLSDLELLRKYGAEPVLNVIKNYVRDESVSFFSTDVYSYHVDRSPLPTDTFLCTYEGASSDLLPNHQAQQKIRIPEIRNQLMSLHGEEDGFEDFLSEFFFDLHYQELPGASPVNLGVGNLWRLAVDHPESNSLPCIHRAPMENGAVRLLLIC